MANIRMIYVHVNKELKHRLSCIFIKCASMVLENLFKEFYLGCGCHSPRLMECLHILKHLVNKWIEHYMFRYGLMSIENIYEILQGHIGCGLINLFISLLVFVMLNQGDNQSFVYCCCLFIFLLS